MKRKIGLFGGSFDPIHLGHEALAISAILELGLDRLIVMPANVQPFKQDWKVTDGLHRLRMIKLALSDEKISDDTDDKAKDKSLHDKSLYDLYNKIEISDFELSHTNVSYTYGTLTYVQELYPQEDNEIFFIMGTDSLFNFETWYRARSMFKMMSIAVASRPGYKEEELRQKIDYYRASYDARIYLLEGKMRYCSSTRVRELLQDMSLSAVEELRGYLNPKVISYINENNLYRN